MRGDEIAPAGKDVAVQSDCPLEDPDSTLQPCTAVPPTSTTTTVVPSPFGASCEAFQIVDKEI